MSTPRRRNLGAVFGASVQERADRAEGLGDLLPLRGADAPAAGAAVSAPSPATPEQATAALSGLRGVAVYLDEDTVSWLRRTASSRDRTYSEVVLDAFEQQAANLDDLLAAPVPQKAAGALFRARKPRPSGPPTPKVQVQLRLTAEELAVIDQLARTHHAPSRTALVSTVLRAAADE